MIYEDGVARNTDYAKDKLFVSVVSALRSYSDLHILGENEHSLERIIDSSVSLYKERKFEDFSGDIIRQLRSIICLNDKLKEEQTSGFTATKFDDIYVITSGFGRYRKFRKLYMEDMIEADVLHYVMSVTEGKSEQFMGSQYVENVMDQHGGSHIIYLDAYTEIADWDKNLIGLFGSNIGQDFDRLYDENEAETSETELLYAIGEVTEARSQTIGNHVERVRSYSRFIATKLGLKQETVDLISHAATIHDIGKLMIPEEILNKPSKLSAEEFEVVKRHSLIGHKILKDAEEVLYRLAADIAVSHHEKYDGTGYPHGLIGEEIPLSGRIVALADVVDALSSDSVYKKAWSFDRVIELIKEESGQHFDPKVVTAFLNHLDEFMQLKLSLEQ